MKRTSILIILLVLGLGAVAIASFTTGYGETITANVAPTQVKNFTTANNVSIYNSGTSNMYVLANLTTNQMVTRIAAGTAIVIPGGLSYTFDAAKARSIESVCYAGVTNGISGTIAAF